jgi:aspartyl-tRNA(Asn)/glutamyl-tRNA(Gln) amidotransferase subunit B
MGSREEQAWVFVGPPVETKQLQDASRQRDIAIVVAFAVSDVKKHAVTVDVADLEVSPAYIAELAKLVESGKINDRIGRDVLTAVLAGEGSPSEIVAAKGLEVVSDDVALLAAIDEALASQPDVIDAIREGRMQAAGAVIGAVMKAMKGQADAARVRELLIQRAGE